MATSKIQLDETWAPRPPKSGAGTAGRVAYLPAVRVRVGLLVGSCYLQFRLPKPGVTGPGSVRRVQRPVTAQPCTLRTLERRGHRAHLPHRTRGTSVAAHAKTPAASAVGSSTGSPGRRYLKLR